MVVIFVVFSIVGGKLYLCIELLLCNFILIVIILFSVLLGSRLGLNVVLFFFMSESVFFFSVLECGMVRIKRVIDESFGNWFCLLVFFMVWMEF